MEKYLRKTALLDYTSKNIKRLVETRDWKNLDTKNKILSIYNYIRDEIKFGYNISDNIPASRILTDGYGQCNTKGILFMALLRAVGIPCRIHGFYVDKKLQKGAVTGIWYKIAPRNILHSWIEVYYNDTWLNLEGFILDVQYLSSLQNLNKDCTGSFCGYGVADNNFQNPSIYWNGRDTYIQKESITEDLGIFDDPDTFFSQYSQSFNVFKKFIFRNIVRHTMNNNVNRIREN